MKEFVDIRLPEDWAAKHLDGSWGQPMALPHDYLPITRQVIIETCAPRLSVLKEKLVRFPPNAVSANVRREYSPSELSEARLLHLIFTEFVDMAGVDYGTVYDDSAACPRCGFGRKQLSPLRLDFGKIQNNVPFATTIARGDEILVSEPVCELMRRNAVTGCRLDAAEHVGRGKPRTSWYQLVVSAEAGATVPPTRFGKDFLRDDEASEFTCQEHLLSGLTLVSEVFLEQKRVAHSDFLRTTNRYGMRSGLLMPSPIFLISQNFHSLLRTVTLNGYGVEVARI